MAKKLSLADSIKASLPTRNQGFAPWHQRLDAETLAELKTVKAEWQNGTLVTGCQTLAKAISKQLNDDGLSTIGPQGVITWLRRPD